MINKKAEEYEHFVGVYAIFDQKQEIFDSPYMATNDINAKRRFILMIDEENSVLARWHSDYDLYKLAQFSTKTGYFEESVPTKIFEGKSYIKKGERE